MSMLIYGLLASQLSTAPLAQASNMSAPKDSKMTLNEILIQTNIDDPNSVFVSGLSADLDLKVDMDRNLLPLIHETQDREVLEAMNGEW